MLQQLSVKNYALIGELEMDLSKNMTIITGETGAGKSILLGALGLVLGSRPDVKNILLNPDTKCTVEATFEMKGLGLEPFFDENDLDFEDITIIRREIMPNGKSRAFINDSPASLAVLKNLSGALIDVNSQHQTLQLGNADFQLTVVDSLAQHTPLLASYTAILTKYNRARAELKQVTEAGKRMLAELEFSQFTYEELKKANLHDPSELDALETEQRALENVELIQTKLSHAIALLTDDETATSVNLKQVVANVQAVIDYQTEVASLLERLESALIEVKDISQSLDSIASKVVFDDARLAEVSSRVSLLFTLLRKHNRASLSELIEYRNSLKTSIAKSNSYANDIAELTAKMADAKAKAESLATQISTARQATFSNLEQEVGALLVQVGMPNAQFKVEHHTAKELLPGLNGFDQIKFMFNANKGRPLGDLSKVASGGELSRLMLCLKVLIAQNVDLPTLVFDEIDTGVSGEVAKQVGQLMQRLANSHQVITITHLAQIAAKGQKHFFVYKHHTDTATETQIRELNQNERLVELATMMQGTNPSQTAIDAAKELMND